MRTSVLMLSLLASLGAGQAIAEEGQSPQALFDQNCTSCHQSDELFTRDDRKVTSLNQLESQVRWCESNLELGWFDDEILAMTQYLNDRYYKFTP